MPFGTPMVVGAMLMRDRWPMSMRFAHATNSSTHLCFKGASFMERGRLFCVAVRQNENGRSFKKRTARLMVGARGFEPPTPASRRQCSTRLSYAPSVAGGLALLLARIKCNQAVSGEKFCKSPTFSTGLPDRKSRSPKSCCFAIIPNAKGPETTDRFRAFE